MRAQCLLSGASSTKWLRNESLNLSILASTHRPGSNWSWCAGGRRKQRRKALLLPKYSMNTNTAVTLHLWSPWIFKQQGNETKLGIRQKRVLPCAGWGTGTGDRQHSWDLSRWHWSAHHSSWSWGRRDGGSCLHPHLPELCPVPCCNCISIISSGTSTDSNC